MTVIIIQGFHRYFITLPYIRLPILQHFDEADHLSTIHPSS